MVAIAIQNPITERALSVSVSERDAKPAPQHANEKGWLVVKPRSLRKHGVHIHAGPFSANKVKVGTPRPASRVAKLSERALVHSCGKLLLGKLFGAELLQLVAAAHSLVERVESHPLRDEAVGSAARRLQNVVRIQLLAELNAAGARGKESGVAVLSTRPQPKTSRASPKRGL